MFKKILFIILCFADLYLAYATIGFTIMGATAPKLYGEPHAFFMGNYVLSIVFGIAFIVDTLVVILMAINMFNLKKKKWVNLTFFICTFLNMFNFKYYYVIFLVFYGNWFNINLKPHWAEISDTFVAFVYAFVVC